MFPLLIGGGSLRRTLLRLSLAALSLSFLHGGMAGLAVAATPPNGESYFGFDLDLLAKSFAYLTTYRTQYGEKDGRAHFDQWLDGVEQTRASFDSAYDAWWKRWKSDPTGQLEARFHALNSKYTQEMNFADVHRHDQEKREGVTLDQYARIVVALSRPPRTDPAQIDHVLRTHGVAGQAQWTKINAAWTQAMHDDTSLGLVQQYGALYQKYAGPAFEKAAVRDLEQALR
jgi:hypothetical protein